MTPSQMYNKFLDGFTTEEIGKEVGLSKQRICQILQPYREHNNDLRVSRPAKEYIRSKSPIKKQLDIFHRRRQMARKANIDWTLVFSSIVWPEKCPILNIPLQYQAGKGRSNASPSLDRVDPSKDYTSDNVQVISWRANRLKSDGTLEEHKAIYEYMMRYRALEVK